MSSKTSSSGSNFSPSAGKDWNGLAVVDGLQLSRERREALRPGEEVKDGAGHVHTLPRFFFRVESWEQACKTKLTEHFTLAELMHVDSREIDLLLRQWPHYVPCAAVIFARYLELFRLKVDAQVCIAANGGYRSPAHRLTENLGPHNWGTAANVYAIGNRFLDSQKDIEDFGKIARGIAPELNAKPYGHGDGETDDHLHLDIGFVLFVPRDCNEAR